MPASVYFASSGSFGRLTRSPKQPQLNNNNSSRQSNPSRGFSHGYSGGAGYSVNSSEAQSTATNTYMPSVLASNGPAATATAVAAAALPQQQQQQQQQYTSSSAEVLSPVMRGVSSKAAAAAASASCSNTGTTSGAGAAAPRLATAYEQNSSSSLEERQGSEHC
jgi:hypothetical protein